MEIPLSEAKAKFSELVRRVEAGETITVTRHGKPVVVMGQPGKSDPRPSLVGGFEGKIELADDFDEIPEELKDYVS